MKHPVETDSEKDEEEEQEQRNVINRYSKTKKTAVIKKKETVSKRKEEIIKKIKTENNLVIDINKSLKHKEISEIAKTISTTRQVQKVEERRNKLLRFVQDELLHATSLEEIKAAEQVFAPLKPTLAAVRTKQTNFRPLLPICHTKKILIPKCVNFYPKEKEKIRKTSKSLQLRRQTF
ncbi:unnamed protein product [Brassicogethes aeneus]|uniref:Uncharacterized protein n=1 Tax=Brassicogethes aeneus TaxID=1431903 RepID=A0A9P0BIP3_BRAAE|nr:unnamed protein product [Brassicogethes aeneus]